MAGPVANTWEQCRQAVADVLDGLHLPGLLPGSILVCERQLWNDPVNVTYPALVVSLQEGVESPPHSVKAFGLVEVGYPVCVDLFNRDPGRGDSDLAAWYAAWRNAVACAFRNQRLSGVRQIWQVRVEPRPAFEKDDKRFQFFASGLLLRCLSREPVGGVPG